MTNLNINKRLPPDLTIKSIDSEFYRIGLMPEDYGNTGQKRSQFHHPFLILMIIFMSFIKNNINILLTKDNLFLSKVLGDYASFIGMGVHFDIILDLASILVMGSQLICHYNYRIGIRPEFLVLFQMLAGRVAPRNVGLTNSTAIISMVKSARMYSQFLRINNQICIPWFAFSSVVLIYYLNSTLRELLLYGCPNIILNTMFMYHSFNVVLYQIIHFHLICQYFKHRIKELNKTVVKCIERKNSVNIQRMLTLFNTTYAELNRQNTDFWSKFLLLFWLTFGSIDVLVLYIIFFIPIPVFIKVLLFYCWLLLSALLLFVILSSSSVNSEANNTYEILNRFEIYYSRNSVHQNRRLTSYITTTNKLKARIFCVTILCLSRLFRN